MPFIPNEKFKVGDWVYLKSPVLTPRGTQCLSIKK
jgi:hypothetical protein